MTWTEGERWEAEYRGNGWQENRKIKGFGDPSPLALASFSPHSKLDDAG